MRTRKWLVRIPTGYLIRPVGSGSIIPNNCDPVPVETVAVLKTGRMRTKVQFLVIFLVTIRAMRVGGRPEVHRIPIVCSTSREYVSILDDTWTRVGKVTGHGMETHEDVKYECADHF